MNRPLLCAAALLSVMLAAAPVRAAAPLVVGSVRDQEGGAIEGAVVSAQTATGERVAATTNAAGTFAIAADGVVALSVTCRYCETARVSPRPGEPVVVIVRRYQALSQDTPSVADLANLPYAHVESSVALRPFTLLAQSSEPYPGSQVSDRGLSSSGSLLIDNGASNYDIVAGESPYVLIPANYQQSAAVYDASNAYLYGDRAAGGIVELDPFLSDSAPQIALGGSDAIARLQAGSDTAAIAAGTSSNDAQSQQRVDLWSHLQLDDAQSLTFAAGTGQGRDYQIPQLTFAGNFSFADSTFSDARLLNLALSAVVDRGDYVMSVGEYPISTVWSDSEFSAGVHSNGPIAAFGDLSVRASSGTYDAQALPGGFPRIGAMLTQTRADGGFNLSGKDYSVAAGVGAFSINYTGGTHGVSWPASVALVEPSVSAKLFPHGKWSVDIQDAGSFTLPTFLVQYQYLGVGPHPVAYQRNALVGEALNYTDDSRVRFSFEHALQSVQGASAGTVSSTGFSATWQVAPAIALRAWTMHVADNVAVYSIVPPYGGVAPTVNAVWLTYDPGSALRVDAIYRRDLLNGEPFYHFDGAVSGPAGYRLRWYAGVEDWMHRTFINAGLRFSAR